ncbi:hypothetical protein [Hydrogenoanaerobacterium sp.]|uniref:hypothetical protein n=1 Tax=Hydrogenoanaerobacterium sp. TaxID=2953763 RepID=UPI00289D838C|nr:hypothetical protein [Hydrogenoanaerobacterium sp.]
MKTSTRIICICLAALMLLTTFGMLFSQLAFAATTDSNSSSSSSKDDDELPVSSGSFRVISKPQFYRVGSDGVPSGDPVKTVKEGYRYQVVFTVLDKSVNESDISNVTGGFVASSGGYFDTIVGSDGFPESSVTQGGSSSGYVELDIEAYVKFNGKGRTMSLDVGYTYSKNTSDSSDRSYGESNGTVVVKIPEAVVTSGSESDEDSYLLATPNIIVTSYNYGGQDVMAGNNFPLTIKFENTSKDFNLENIIMEITTSTDLSIANGSNSTYIEKLGKGESQTKTLQIAASSAIEPKPQQVTVKFTYEYILDKVRKTGERTETLAIPVTQLDRFSIGELSVPDQLWPGDNTYMSIEYVNKGKTEIANLSAHLESDVPGISQSQTVGNIKAGDSGTIDFTFTANDSGTINGKVIVTYEDAKGNEKSVERPFSATVMDMGGMFPGEDPTDMPLPMPGETGPNVATIVMAVIGGLMVAGLTGIIIVKKVKMKREEEDDEDI